MKERRRSPIERFWSQVDKRGPNECWLWKSSLNSSGYGYISIGSIVVGAHVWAYEMKYGPLGERQIHHRCNTRNCVNPRHMKAMTRRDHEVWHYKHRSNLEPVYEVVDEAKFVAFFGKAALDDIEVPKC